jgi:hypothetical protein
MCSHECISCPFNFFSEESNEAQNMGCLPEPFNIKSIYEKLNGVWGCHDTSEEEGNLKPCIGFIQWMKSKGTPIKIKGKTIVDYSRWNEDPEYFKLNDLDS